MNDQKEIRQRTAEEMEPIVHCRPTPAFSPRPERDPAAGTRPAIWMGRNATALQTIELLDWIRTRHGSGLGRQPRSALSR